MALPPSVSSQAPVPVLVGRMRGAFSGVERFAAQPAVRRSLPAILVVGVTVLALAVWFSLREAPRVALYPGIAEAEKARMIESLTGAGIPAAISASTGEVEVDQADYYKARMALAAEGLPETLPDAETALGALQLGTSRPVEATRLRQAQELELARSITEIAGVASARVHLALPERTAFLRDTQPPRASIFLQLEQGRALASGQVDAIVNLVASAIPGLPRESVSVVDQRGQLLSRVGDDPALALTDRQMQQRVQLEDLYRTRIEQLLTPITGLGNMSVQVSLDMDFTRSEIREERMDPQGSVLRSEQVENSETRNSPARGIPGQVSNTPPAEATPAAGSPPTAEGNTAPPKDDANAPTNSTSGTTRNYEVSRRFETIQPATGRITRINAAILVRAVPAPAPADGSEPPADAPLIPPAQIADMERLVQSAIGFDDKRGDSITIMAQPFLDPAEEVLPIATADSGWLGDAIRQGSLILILGIVALGIVRPLLMRLTAPTEAAPAGMANALTDGSTATAQLEAPSAPPEDTPEHLEAQAMARRIGLARQALSAGSRDEKFAILRQLAEEDPVRIATVLRRMMKDEIEKVV